MKIISIIHFLFLLFASHFSYSQIILLNPSDASADKSVELIFDATQGNKELIGASKVYIHHGVITDGPSSTSWKYVKGNWGKDDGIGQMTKVPGQANKWSIKLDPTIRSYFGVPVGTDVYRISCVFRNADGSKKGTIASGNYSWGSVAPNQDYFINLSGNRYVEINTPLENEVYRESGQSIAIMANASSNASNIKLFIDEGTGFIQKSSSTNTTAISYDYTSTISQIIKIKVEAVIDGQTVTTQKSISITIIKPTVVEALPVGMKPGVNYDATDPTTATLVLTAPQKQFIYIVGDFNQWTSSDNFQMKRSIDAETYWITLKGLTPSKPYAYQYWIDGKIKISDPYATKIADPWNDKSIDTYVYPSPLAYDKTQYGLAAILQTGQPKFEWSTNEKTWQKPDVNHLVIYELLVRDFVKTHSYKDVIDSLPYLKKLGINAIELMPVSEFEGNDSWGYNPSHFFALDKYYGTAHDLKSLIDEAHKHGIAVIMDIVLNHTFGLSPNLQMYFDAAANKPALNNPWYNREYVGQYQWGYDINHESNYTKKWIDDINAYWLTEFHFDGFRFDFTKGFTNYAPNNNVDGYDASRINILSRMANKLWEIDPKAYVILEHWAPESEESALAAKGMKMWRNKSYDFVPAAVGNPTGTFANTDNTSYMTLISSHDEERVARHMLDGGLTKDGYDIKNPQIMIERTKMLAAFYFLQPGQKMIWMFDELGYDVSINFNGRLGRKPLPWGTGGLGYYEDINRKYIYEVYADILKLRNKITPQKLKEAAKQHQLTGEVRRLTYNTDDIDLVLIGNLGLTTKSIPGQFSTTGKWYDYFTGDSIQVASISIPISLKPGEWHIYTNKKLNPGDKNKVALYSNPVTISPLPFATNDDITITFDATKAWPKNTNGLMNSTKVYMQAGIVLSNASTNTLTNIVGTGLDDGIGEMKSIGNNKWEIKINPRTYFNILTELEAAKIGMYFRDAENKNVGYGFRDDIVYFNVKSNEPIVSVSPASFDANTEITITFDATKGNRELVGASKVYMHSGIGTTNVAAPGNAAWTGVVGNWAQDDGIGQMTKVAGQSDKWQIKFKPKTYYNMADGKFPYWIAAVFRNADGSKKGTGEPGIFAQGYIADNLDFFIKNQAVVSVEEKISSKINLFPNPVTSYLRIDKLDKQAQIEIINLIGQKVLSQQINAEEEINVSLLQPGLYHLLINMENETIVKRFFKD